MLLKVRLDNYGFKLLQDLFGVVGVLAKHVDEVLTGKVAGLCTSKEEGQALINYKLVVIFRCFVIKNNLQKVALVLDVRILFALTSSSVNDFLYQFSYLKAVRKNFPLKWQDVPMTKEREQQSVRRCHPVKTVFERLQQDIVDLPHLKLTVASERDKPL